MSEVKSFIKNQYDNVPINSPFRWAGGKFYARKIIGSYIPKHNFYIEPFVGGGSIFFYKNKVKSILNDYDEELINCFKHIRDDVKKMIDYLSFEKATKIRHKFYKEEYAPKNKFEKAIRYYYLNRTSYSGIMKKQNCFFGYGEKYSMRPENWGRQLIKNNLKLKNVELYNLDFEELISKYKNKDAFIFLDPPYFNADQDKFYTVSFNYEDHLRLMKLLKKLPNNIKFLLTYDNSKEIRSLYKWAKIKDPQEWNYTISRTDDQKNKKKMKDGHFSKRNKGKELFITNYKVSKKEQLSLAL